jgi:hypothetical protein
MEESNNSFIKNTMTTGAILGTVLIAYTLIINLTGLSNNTIYGLIADIFFIGGIMYGIKQVRDKVQDGFISYGRGVGAGVLVSVFAGIILAFYTFINLKYFDQSVIPKTMEAMQQKWVEKGMTDDQIELMTPMLEVLMKPGFLAFFKLLGLTFMGTIFSLIIAAFMRKEPGIFSNNSFDQ